MLQSLATLAFSTLALISMGLIAILIRADWISVRQALGIRRFGRTAPLPQRMRLVQTQRADIVRVKLGELQRAA